MIKKYVLLLCCVSSFLFCSIYVGGWQRELKSKIRPTPFFFNQLVKNRGCRCVNGCITASVDNTTLLYVDTPNTSEFMMWAAIFESMPQAHINRIIKHVGDIKDNISTIEAKCYQPNDLLESNKITNFLNQLGEIQLC